MSYPARSSSSGRRVVVGLTALMMVASSVSGCSAGRETSGGSSVPALEGASESASAGVEASGEAGEASAGASDGASAVATGLTADSLSDPGSEYAVVSIPEGLDATQSEVLSAFVAYDRASWKAVRDMDGTGEVEATATGQKLADFTKEYKDQEATGQHVEGSSSAEVLAVDLMPDNLTASVGVCNDLTRAKLVSASGEDQTPEDVPHRFPMSYILMREGSGWKVANSSHGEADQC